MREWDLAKFTRLIPGARSATALTVCSFTGVAIFFLATTFCAAAAEPKQVMLLHSFGRDFKPWSEYAKAIRAEIDRQSPWPLNVHEHSLEIARSSDEHPEGPFVEYLRALYANQQPDLIVSIGAPAAAFVQRHRQQLFPSSPMLLTVVDQRRVRYSVLTANDVVVAVAIDYVAAIENILQVLPDTKHVMIVTGRSPIEIFWKETIGKDVERFAGRFEISWTDHLSFEDLLKHAAALSPNTAIFWELMIVDAAGAVHEEGKALARLHAVANAPIFSYTDAFFGREIVGGPHVPVLEHGQTVADVAIRILAGVKAGDIQTPPTGMGTPRFDWREMQRWNISESRLPPGSRIEFRDPSAWEQYRAQILAVVTALVLQAVLIAWLIYEQRRRRFAEVLARNSMSELAHVNRVATAGELSASIAHEVTQPLTGIVANANAASRLLSNASPDLEKVRTALGQIVDAGHRTSDVVRSMRAMFRKDIGVRRPINMNNLIATVLALLKVELEKHKIRVETHFDKDLPSITGEPVQLQQVLLNLITNAMDAMCSVSSRPRVLRLRTECDQDKKVLVLVQDSGTGIRANDADQIFKPLFTTKSQGMGMGLSICRSIIEAHDGKIWASPDGEYGSVFQFVLPVHGREDSPR
jgi:signal transduction histidine kinase